MLQLLREGEAWQWGGVTVGFQFRIGRAPGTHDDVSSSSGSSNKNAGALPSVVLRTLSLEPKVLQVEAVLGAAVQSAVIASGKASMMRSPERHYSPGFENYRTSKSSFLTGQHPSHAIVRVDEIAVDPLYSIICTLPGNPWRTHLPTRVCVVFATSKPTIRTA